MGADPRGALPRPRAPYEDGRLYCLRCETPPDYFHEVMAWQVNRVMPDGTLIDMKDGEVQEYCCPQCDDRAKWGWELNIRSTRGKDTR